jgi:hypothetical protein
MQEDYGQFPACVSPIRIFEALSESGFMFLFFCGHAINTEIFCMKPSICVF